VRPGRLPLAAVGRDRSCVRWRPQRAAGAGRLRSPGPGLTHEAYALDLRQFVAWCAEHHLRLFGACRADIECFARDLEARGRARATDRHAAWRIVRRLARKAGINKAVGPHTLRHAFITAALDAGVPLRDVQEAASHADPRTTMRYDRARVSLDRHATYIVAAFLAGAAR
jgi:site-specific recombinase XerD